MNRRLSLLLLPLALAGCATHSRVSADEGLRARLGRGPDGLRVVLSEPAYIAVFQVEPGQRVALRYPFVESDPRLIPAGRTLLEPDGFAIHPYRSSLSGRAPVLYLIASRRPLDEALLRDMREEWGVLDSDSFRSGDPRETMARLAALVVPGDQPAVDWATAAFTMRHPPGSIRSARSNSARGGGGGVGTAVYCGLGRPVPTSSNERICP
jgi:hypothetical protein